MAVQATWTTQNYFTAASTLQRRQVIEILDVMSPREISFLQLVGTNGEAGKNPKLEWMNDALLAESSLVESNPLASEAGPSTLVVPTGHGINFQVGNLLLIESEYLYVSAVSTDSLTVVRGVGDSSPAQHDQGVEIKILSIANFEDAARPKAGTKEPTFEYNFFQSFDTGFDMSYVSMNTDVYGQGPMREAREMARAIEQATIKLEKTAFDGIRLDQQTTVTPRFMGGLRAYYPTSGGLNYAKDLGGQPLTEADIINALEDRFYAVGSQNMAKTLIVGSWNARRISDIYAPSARMERNSRTGGVVVDTIDTQFGPVDVLLNLRCPKDRVYLVNVDFLKVHPYTGLSFADYELAVTGAQISRQIYGVYSMSARNVKSGGVIFNTATS